MLYIHNIIVSSVWCVVQASKNRAEKRYVKRITAFFVIMFTHTFLPIEFMLTYFSYNFYCLFSAE